MSLLCFNATGDDSGCIPGHPSMAFPRIVRDDSMDVHMCVHVTVCAHAFQGNPVHRLDACCAHVQDFRFVYIQQGSCTCPGQVACTCRKVS